MTSNYAFSAAKVAVAQLAEAAGFDAVQTSSLDTLADLLMRYINEVGSAAHSYAELAGRTESNPLDVLLALNDLGVSLGQLSEYEKKQDEIPYAQSIAPFPIKRKAAAVPTFLDKGEAPPSHIPNFLPAFPDKHTYVSTPAYVGHERDPSKRQQKESQARQDAVRAVVKLQARMAPDNKLLEKRAPAAPAAPAGEGGAEEGGANPFLAPTLWEDQPAEPIPAVGLAGPSAAGPAAAGAGEPGGAGAAAAAGGAGPARDQAAGAAAASLAGEWEVLAGEMQQAPAAAAPLFVSWDWKAHLQKKARLAVSGGEHKDAFGQAVDLHGPGTKHGRRGKRTERAVAAQLEMGDPTRRRVDEILAAHQEEVPEGIVGEEEAAAAQDQELI